MTQDSPQNCRCGHRLSRRSVLVHSGAAATLALAGCLGDSDETPAPVAITSDAACDNCGMIISKHPGPNGEMFYADTAPDSHDPPFWFDSLKMCLFPMLLEGRELGYEATAIYATDYSSVEYELQTEGEKTFISSHTDPTSLAKAQDLTYVVGSDVEGAMGPDFIPFSNPDEAASFADDYNGRTVDFEDIDEGMVGR